MRKFEIQVCIFKSIISIYMVTMLFTEKSNALNLILGTNIIFTCKI